MTYGNSGDSDQTAPEEAVWSGSTLFTILLNVLRKDPVYLPVQTSISYFSASVFVR